MSNTDILFVTITKIYCTLSYSYYWLNQSGKKGVQLELNWPTLLETGVNKSKL